MVKLYAAAMFPGFMLALLYLIYVIVLAKIKPKVAPPLPPEQQRVPLPPLARARRGQLLAAHAAGAARGRAAPARALRDAPTACASPGRLLLRSLFVALVPLAAGAW